MRIPVVLGVLLAAAPAGADGWRVGGAIGPGVAVGRFGWEGPGARMGEQIDAVDVGTYAMLAADLRVGRSLTPRFALALELCGVALAGDEGRLGQTVFRYGAGASMRAVASWRDARERSFTVGAGAALARFVGTTEDTGNPAIHFETVVGPSLAATVGWPMDGARLELELAAAYLVAEHLSYAPVTLTMRVRFGEI